MIGNDYPVPRDGEHPEKGRERGKHPRGASHLGKVGGDADASVEDLDDEDEGDVRADGSRGRWGS